MTVDHTPASPLIDEHRELGASFTDFAGWAMPLKYGSELAEHRAVRETAGLFDLSHMGEISITGPQSAVALDFALVGEASKIAVGRAKYSLMCDTDGGVIDDLVVYRLADEHFLVVANAANAPTVADELRSRAGGFDAKVDDQSLDTALIAVQGPASESIVSSLVPEGQTVRDLKYYAATEARVGGIDVLLARTGYTGEDGFELYVPNAHAVDLWRLLLAATTAAGGSPAGLACRDTLRLEAGMALYGHELDKATNPYEAGLGKVVRLTKDFVGRDALQQLSEQTVQRVLVGLKGSTRRAARAGYTVHHDRDGAPVGIVTSGALSPTLGYPIALAYLDASLAEPGTVLHVDIRGNKEQFEVTPAPFYRRN
ncbi:glycine cleavage system aminomethyltransferase GcvT [Mycolicibacterium brisbanense]